MNCKEFKKRIIPYIENNLNESDYDNFVQHIENCNSCKILLEKIKESYDFTNLKASNIEDPFFYTRLVQKLENRSTENHTILKTLNRRLQPVYITALILIGIYFGIYLGNSYHSNQTYSEEVRKNQIDAYAKDNYIILAENENLENFFISNK
jgi:hypothetical protein